MYKLSSLRQLRYLVALYELKHFGQAAKACFISQSTLSASITNLEDVLDVQILERDHKRFLFTAVGEEIVERARSILQQSTELEEFAKNQGKQMQGKLYLGIIPTIAPFILSELQLAVQKEYPKLTLLIREDTTENILHLLAEGKLDAAILALPYPTGDFYTYTLAKDYFQMVLPKTWQAKRFVDDIQQLPKQSVFLLEKEHCLTDHSLQACQLKDSQTINPFFATSLHTLIQMVEHQPGITFLPELAIKSGILLGTDLIALPINNKEAYREIGMVWRNTSYRKASYILLAHLIEKILNYKTS